MDQLKKLFGSLSLQQKIMLALAVVAVLLGVPAWTRWQHERGFRPLFTNMAPEDAAAVIQKLKEGGVEHRLADQGATVLVPSEKVDEARLSLAGAGLPKTGRIGFELFDKTNIGLTDFSEHVNYRRALEGELERSLKVLSEIEQARVHISFPKDSIFLDSREPAKASVLVSLRPGVSLTPRNVLAITNLLASAVEGLSPEFVSVVDMQGTLLSRPHKALDEVNSADGALEYQHQVEKDLMLKVEATLGPLLGEGKFRVGVSADCDLSTSEQTDETYDPTRSVMATSQKTEDLSSSGGIGGVPGTPSNLPRSTIKPMGGVGSAGGVSRRAENVSFETSRTVKQVKTPRGSIRRISAALLLDQPLEWQGKGTQRKRVNIVPAPEKLKAIHDVVAGVLGIVPERGDQLVIESLAFEQTRALSESLDTAGTPAGKGPAPKFYEDKRVLIGGGVVLVLAVALLVFKLLRKREPAETALERDAVLASKAELSGGAQVAAGEEAPALASGPGALPAITTKTQSLLAELKESVSKDPAFAANIVRSWLED
ncbi:MAG TPA: flagellar basal-body MS-ring/collar protein FliF [Bryobacteraceae bacterium]|nr:flagellar basal-body MS-ring/collar protein FliF [Bryobacteraceae bacterium]